MDRPDGDAPARLETQAEAAARVGLRAPNPKARRWAVPITVIAGAALLVVPVLSILPARLVAEEANPRTGELEPTPYARTPAAAEPVADRVVIGDLSDFEGVEQYPPEGDFYFVTVTEPTQSILSWIAGRDQPAIEFLTDEEKYGLRTPEQRRTFALESMRTSEQVAQYVALQRLGYDVDIVPGDVLIESMVCLEPNEDGSACLTWSPSDDVLDPFDRIVEVDGEPVDTVDDLGRLLDGYAPGDVVPMTIERGDEQLDVDVELTASPDDPERTIVGFFPFDTAQVELPFELDIDTGSIGGPSAGLAFTLTLIDELSEGELTGGGRVAVTGSIQLDGTIGPIGGLAQKASAVAQTGVDVFLVPEAQGEDNIAAARLAGGDGLEIIPVATLDDALRVLEELGGDPIPPRPSPTTD